MKKIIPVLALVCSLADADCLVNVVNTTNNPVTFASSVRTESGTITTLDYLTVPAKSKTVQAIPQLVSCNTAYKYSDGMALSVQLKNDTGYWVGDKGFLYSKDKSYAKVSNSGAKADNNQPITLSNGLDITDNVFNVRICDIAITSDDCN